MFFDQEGNCVGTNVIEHPVHSPKGLPPIGLKNRPINPGLVDALKEQGSRMELFALAESPLGIFLFFLSRKRMVNGDGLLTSECLMLPNANYSHRGIGTVLSQVQDGVETPIAFNACGLKTSKSQYASHKAELLALIFAIDTHKFLLTGRKFLVQNDNLALSCFKTQKDPKGILMRWLRILSTYEFDIQHRGGTKHGNAESLSHSSHTPFLSKPEATEV